MLAILLDCIEHCIANIGAVAYDLHNVQVWTGTKYNTGFRRKNNRAYLRIVPFFEDIH